MKCMFLKKALFAICLTLVFTACDDDPSPTPPPVTKGNYIIGVSTEAKSYLLATDNLESGKTSVIGNGVEASESTIYSYQGKKGFLFLYRKGDPATVQSCSFLGNGTISLNKTKSMPTREEFIAPYKNYMIAMTSIKLEDSKFGEAFNFIDGETENIQTSYMTTENIAHPGEYANMGGLITIGDDLITALEPYRIPTTDNANTKSNYPDEVNLAILNRNGDKMTVKKVIKDERASFAVGRRRSGRLSCIGTDANGDIYVFSPANQVNTGDNKNPKPENGTKHPSSVLKINKSNLEFDKNYYFNIESKSGGLKLQNAFALYGDYFLLNMFATTKAWNMQTANKFAIFNVKTGDFKWVSGLPAPEDIGGYTPRPYIEGEKVYLPLTASGKTYVHLIDAKTANATKGIEIEGDVTVGTIIKLDIPNK
ncbi:DUF4374 domain-containing protein [Dysgonomonas sp. Marseille-P4677]|uniref:DUF4374 domain-containing protein n=1 Tax=Dysgonomonas sp. Marseille-P4677 TaxID=2364790 RepID=UPI0019119578|nr:DUF4374 domain-containing protein [Dysgonomonas sp. Marseille-P4677]MBK5722190.1 DUF4374 domain-containing protein [Dysgonomonas sp. Marseille-P4677]